MDYKTVMREHGLKSLKQAQSLIRLTRDNEVRDSFSMLEMKKAILETASFDSAKSYLRCYCALCCTYYPKNKMELFPLCNCEVCEECFIRWIRQRNKAESVNCWYCPICEGQKQSISKLRQHLTFIQMIVENRPELNDIRNSICREIAGWTMKVTHKWFRWCENPKCANGYVWELTSPKMKCPSCQGHTCRDCCKQWLPEHDGKTCEEFQAILFQRDPALVELFAVSFACPRCGVIFVLESGGCMHMDCPECEYSFCLGCKQEYFDKNICKQDDCFIGGLHAHHPRNCVYYTRDNDAGQLQELLKSKHIPYEEEDEFISCLCTPSVTQIQSKDDGEIKRTDYTEYLGGLLAENGIDPIELMDEDYQLMRICEREHIQVPVKYDSVTLKAVLKTKKPVKILKYVYTEVIKKKFKKHRSQWK